MYAGDELYDDDVTSGPATEPEPVDLGPWPGDRDRDYDPLEDC